MSDDSGRMSPVDTDSGVTDAERLRAVRLAARLRGGERRAQDAEDSAADAGDGEYRVYLIIMLAIIVVAPALRTAVLGLAPVLA